MSYHEHDGEWEYCLCDEDEEGTPIRVPRQRGRSRNALKAAERRQAERRLGHDRRKAS